MWKSFFGNPRWWPWSLVGTLVIFAATWWKVQLDVEINHWIGSFYDLIQTALQEPGTVAFEEFVAECFAFARIAGIYVVVAVLLEFFTRHFVFRWRTAMHNYYASHWAKLRDIEGAAQRVQEDTMRFARIVESLGVALLRAVMTLVAFLPILWGLSAHVDELPWIGAVDQGLVFVSVLSAAVGTTLLAVVGVKLPGLEFNNQRVEAALRKELVIGEDHADRAKPATVAELFRHVRANYFRLYLHYLYFDLAKWSYLQSAVVVPYIAMGPTIVAGAISLGVLQEVVRAFSRVHESFQ